MENNYTIQILEEKPKEVKFRVETYEGFRQVFEAIDDSEGIIILKDGYKISSETPIGKFLFQNISEYFRKIKKG